MKLNDRSGQSGWALRNSGSRKLGCNSPRPESAFPMRRPDASARPYDSPERRPAIPSGGIRLFRRHVFWQHCPLCGFTTATVHPQSLGFYFLLLPALGTGLWVLAGASGLWWSLPLVFVGSLLVIPVILAAICSARQHWALSPEACPRCHKSLSLEEGGICHSSIPRWEEVVLAIAYLGAILGLASWLL
jgi:hypothetical protein